MVGQCPGRVAVQTAGAARNRATARRSREDKKVREAQKTARMRELERENE